MALALKKEFSSTVGSTQDYNFLTSDRNGKRGDVLQNMAKKVGFNYNFENKIDSLEQEKVSETPDLGSEPILNLPKYKDLPVLKESYFFPLQEWEGYVIEVHRGHFAARLVDLTSRDNQENEEADFPIEDVTDSDLKLLKPGAIFRWSIGYEKSKSGTKKRVSQIVFRRLPKWTKAEIKKADLEAQEISKGIQWE